MAEPQNRNNNDLTDRQNAVSERLEALEAKNIMLKEEIAWMEAAKLRHYFLIGLLFYMLVPVPIYSGAIYLCVTKNNGVPWFLVLWNNFFYGVLLFFVSYLVMDWTETASQAMCEPLRELLEMAETQEADRRELRQEEEAIRRAHGRRHYQEQLHQHMQQMVGRGRNVEDILQQPETMDLDEDDVTQCTICLEQFNFYEQFNLYGDVVILACQHIFHRACIQLWLPHKDTCPVCRTKIDTNHWHISDMDMDEIDD